LVRKIIARRSLRLFGAAVLEFVFDVPIARCASSVNRKTIRGDALWDE